MSSGIKDCKFGNRGKSYPVKRDLRVVNQQSAAIEIATQKISNLPFSEFRNLNSVTYAALNEIGVLEVLKNIQNKQEEGSLERALTQVEEERTTALEVNFEELVRMVEEVIEKHNNAKSIDFADANTRVEINEQISNLPILGYILNTRKLINLLLVNKIDIEQTADPLTIWDSVKKISNEKDLSKKEIKTISSSIRNMISFLHQQACNDLNNGNNAQAEKNYLSAKELLEESIATQTEEELRRKNQEKLILITGQIETCLKGSSGEYEYFLKLFQEIFEIIYPNLSWDLEHEDPQKLIKYLKIFLSSSFREHIKKETIDDVTLIALQNLALEAVFKFKGVFSAEISDEEKSTEEQIETKNIQNPLNKLIESIKSRIFNTKALNQEQEGTMIEKIKLIAENHCKYVSETFKDKINEKINNDENEHDFSVLLDYASQLGALNQSLQEFAPLIKNESKENNWSKRKKIIENYNHKNWVKNVEDLVIHNDTNWGFRMEKIIVETIGEIIDAYHPNTFQHSKFVATRMVKMYLEYAKEKELDAEEIKESCRTLYFSGMLHDLGKLFVNKSTLNKPGKLTDDEFKKEIKAHPELGYLYALRLGFPEKIAIIIKEHHEKFNGTGYPDGKSEKEITFFSEIAKIADSTSAMMERGRKYNEEVEFKIQLGKALLEIEACKSTDFDPKVVDLYVKSIGLDEYKDLISPTIMTSYLATCQLIKERKYDNDELLHKEIEQSYIQLRMDLWEAIGRRIQDFTKKSSNPRCKTFIDEAKSMQIDKSTS